MSFVERERNAVQISEKPTVPLSTKPTELLLSLWEQLSSAIDEIDAVVGKNGQSTYRFLFQNYEFT